MVARLARHLPQHGRADRDLRRLGPRRCRPHLTDSRWWLAATAVVADLLAVLDSFALDYVARQKVGGTHLTYGFLMQFPIPPPASA